MIQVGGCQGSGQGRGVSEQLLNGYRVLFCSDEKVLKLERGGGCTSL